MQIVKKTPDEHIASLPDEVRSDIAKLDKEFTKIIPQDRVLWEGVFWGGSQQSIIGYGHISFKGSKGNIEWFVVGLALQKNYISVYVSAVDGKQYLAEKHKNELGKAKVGKSSISFAKLEDIKLDVLLDLVEHAKELMLK